MVGADKNDIRGKLSAALGAQQTPPPDPRPDNSVKDQIMANVGTAALAAAQGVPSAASAAPDEPGKPPKPLTVKERLEAIRRASEDRFPLVFRAEDVEVPVDEARRLAQKGMAADNLEQQRSQLQADKQGWEAFKQWQSWLQRNPDKARAVQDIYEGRMQRPAPVQQSYGDEDLGASALQEHQTNGSAGADPAMAARLERLEQLLQGQQQQYQRQSFEQRLDETVNRHDFLKSDPERADLAKRLAASGLAAGDYQTIDEAVTHTANRLRRIVQAEMESIREQRERQAERFPATQPAQGRPMIPQFDQTGMEHGSKGLRKGKDLIRNWLANAQRSVSSGPGGE